MKFIIFLCLVSSFASATEISYPAGFEKTGITFESSARKALADVEHWYCYTLKYLKLNRMSSLPKTIKTDLESELKFSLCDKDFAFVGIPGPTNSNEKTYVDYASLDLSLFFLIEETHSLGEKDDLVDGLRMAQKQLDGIRTWFSEQTGYSRDRYPNIFDKTKNDWTLSINDWLLKVRMQAVKP